MTSLSEPAGGIERHSILVLDVVEDDGIVAQSTDPGAVMLTCASCGAEMIERKCKLICPCGYFLSCSDYY